MTEAPIDQGSKGYLLEANTIYATSGGAARFHQNQREWHTWTDKHFDDSVTPAIIAQTEKTSGLEADFRKLLLDAD